MHWGTWHSVNYDTTVLLLYYYYCLLLFLTGASLRQLLSKAFFLEVLMTQLNDMHVSPFD